MDESAGTQVPVIFCMSWKSQQGPRYGKSTKEASYAGGLPWPLSDGALTGHTHIFPGSKNLILGVVFSDILLGVTVLATEIIF